jgi:hypothetical protein
MLMRSHHADAGTERMSRRSEGLIFQLALALRGLLREADHRSAATKFAREAASRADRALRTKSR